MNLPSHLAPILVSCGITPQLPVAIALSGGADSMALALLMSEMGHSITTLTVDHGMRPESADEAKQVGEWMRARGIAHHILTPAPMDFIPNKQTRAREMRYAALTGWAKAHGVDALLLAHHADDQAETVALQQHRGDSPPSRAGMALVRMRGGIRLIRPLLGVRKAALVAYLESLGQPWVEDPSNASDAYARNRLRREMDDTQVQTLWHEAQAQGEQRHADDSARIAWVRRHMHEAGSGLTFALDAWRALVADMGTDVLSRGVQAVGHRSQRSRLSESVRLAFSLREDDAGKATLGGCIITWQDGHAEIQPEPRKKALEAVADAPHITLAKPLKQLASEPFWWFNFRPLF